MCCKRFAADSGSPTLLSLHRVVSPGEGGVRRRSLEFLAVPAPPHPSKGTLLTIPADSAMYTDGGYIVAVTVPSQCR